MFVGRLLITLCWTIITVTVALKTPNHGSTSLRPRAPSSDNPNIQSLEEITRSKAYTNGLTVGSCVCGKKFKHGRGSGPVEQELHEKWLLECLQMLFQTSGESPSAIQAMIRTNEYIFGLAVANCACLKQAKFFVEGGQPGYIQWRNFLSKAAAECEKEEYAKYEEQMARWHRTREQMERAASGDEPKGNDESRNAMTLDPNALLDSAKTGFQKYFGSGSSPAAGRGNRPLVPAGRAF